MLAGVRVSVRVCVRACVRACMRARAYVYSQTSGEQRLSLYPAIAQTVRLHARVRLKHVLWTELVYHIVDSLLSMPDS